MMKPRSRRLENSPFPSHRNALKSYEELLHYMTELRDSKVMQRRLQKAEKMKPESERNLLGKQHIISFIFSTVSLTMCYKI